jgi:hypothetical protein
MELCARGIGIVIALASIIGLGLVSALGLGEVWATQVFVFAFFNALTAALAFAVTRQILEILGVVTSQR